MLSCAMANVSQTHRKRARTDVASSGALLEQLDIVYTLRAGRDLLAAQEHVVRVGVALQHAPTTSAKAGSTYRVVGTWHGVERTRGERVPVDDVEVSLVLLGDHLAERL